jgi:hypothetical protein
MNKLLQCEDVVNFAGADAGFVVDFFAEDGAVAARALAGEPVLILPVGTFHRGDQARVVDAGVVQEFADNFAARASRGIRRSRLAVDVDHNGRAVGWYRDVQATPAGVAASFEWTAQGRRALQAGEYAYFSPTIFWELQDRVTGEPVKHQLAGGAITNYPFFGDATALYSDAAEFAVVKSEGDAGEYPARAYLVVEDPEMPSTWHLRVFSWQDGALKLDHGLMGAAKAALTSPGGHRGQRYQGPEREAATSKLKALYEREGLEFKISGGDSMTEDQAQITDQAVVGGLRAFFAGLFKPGERDAEQPPAAGVTAEQFSALQAQVAQAVGLVETFKAERDAAVQRVGVVETALAQAQLARDVEHFAVLAEGFAHLPAETAQLAEHLRWLAGADKSEGQAHLGFFSDLLRQADGIAAQAFQEKGGRGPQLPTSAGARVEQAISVFMKEHAGVSYADAASAVLAADPALYSAYREEV